MMTSKRIVVTGLGLVGPFGVGNEDFWVNITREENLFKLPTRYEYHRLSGEVHDFQISEFLKHHKYARLPLVSQYALASAIMAVEDADINLKKENLEKTGIFFGTYNRAVQVTEKICDTLIEKGGRFVDPILFQETVYNAPASQISLLFGIKGPCFAFPMGPAAGGCAFISAVNYMRQYNMEVALVVAADELSRACHEAFDHLGVISPTDERKEGMRPYDKTRNGTVLAEGAVTIIIETEENALKRGAHIHGEFVGGFNTNDGFGITDNDPEGIGLKMSVIKSMALGDICVEEIDLILGCAPSIKKIDTMESQGLKKALGKKVYDIPVSSIKSTIGETRGPSGLFNLAAGLYAIRDGIVPPTINYEHPDEHCNLNIVKNEKLKKNINLFLANSFSWGGLYNSIIMKKY